MTRFKTPTTGGVSVRDRVQLRQGGGEHPAVFLRPVDRVFEQP